MFLFYEKGGLIWVLFGRKGYFAIDAYESRMLEGCKNSFIIDCLKEVNGIIQAEQP